MTSFSSSPYLLLETGILATRARGEEDYEFGSCESDANDFISWDDGAIARSSQLRPCFPHSSRSSRMRITSSELVDTMRQTFQKMETALQGVFLPRRKAWRISTGFCKNTWCKMADRAFEADCRLVLGTKENAGNVVVLEIDIYQTFRHNWLPELCFCR